MYDKASVAVTKKPLEFNAHKYFSAINNLELEFLKSELDLNFRRLVVDCQVQTLNVSFEERITD